MALESQGTNNPFDGLVDKLGEMNNDQNRMAHEAAVYSKELQDHLETDALNMSAEQRDAMQQLIMTLKEGRLDDLENDKEQLLRSRMEARRDDERNDTLLDVFKQLKLQFRLLQMQFKDEKGSRIFGFLVRTAIFSFLIGAFKGFMTPYANIGKNIVKGATSMGKTLGLPVLFDNIKNVFKQFGTRIAKTFKFSAEGKGGGMFAKAAKGILNAGKDVGKLTMLSASNVGNFLKGMTGFLTGKKGFLMGFTKIESGIKASGLVGQGVNKLVQMVLKPFRMLAQLPVSVAKIFSLGIDRAANSVKGAGKGFANIGTKVFLFFKNAPILKTIFAVLDKFKSTFQTFGKVFGQLLRPILGLIGFVTGFIDGFKSQDDMLNKIIAGLFDGIKGAFRMLVGSLLDFFIITIPGFFLGLFGMDDAKAKLQSFSFAEMFDNMFDAVKNAVLGFFNRLRDGIADIGIGGIIKNISLSLLGILMKIAAFPKAVAMGALSAIAAAMPGGESPGEAFSRKFNEVMSRGQARIDAMKAKKDGKDSDGNIIDALSKEGKILQSQAGQEKYPAGPPTINQSYQNSQGGATVIVNGPPPSDFNFKNAALMNQYSD
tara:strand:+ start:365 stop:2161 length:1797 start_codon:yes stop_codon:yes gene_type:complete